MAQFILFLRNTEEHDRVFAAKSPEEMQRATGEYMEWAKQLREQGKFVGGERLQDEVRVLKPGNVTSMDGPYAESKEAIGGFFQIEAKDLDEATEIAKGCPQLKFGGT